MLEHMTVFVIWSTAYLSLGYELSIPLAYIESSGSSSVGFPYIGKQMATKNIIVWAVFSSMIGKSHKCLWIKIAQQMNTKIRKLFLVYVKSRGGNIKRNQSPDFNFFQSQSIYGSKYYNKHTVQYDPSRSVWWVFLLSYLLRVLGLQYSETNSEISDV